MVNLKGGVAKTTNAVAVAECLADAGHKVLVIDADHQCMASELLIGEELLNTFERKGLTLHDMLAAMLKDEFEEDHIPPYIKEQVSNIGAGFPNLDLLPCSIRIDDFQTNMAKARHGFREIEDFRKDLVHKRKILRRFLNTAYDYVIVDCPPSLAIQVREFFTIGDGFIIPSVPDRLSVRGSAWLLDRMRRGNYKRIQPVGTLWSLYRSQAKVHREIVKLAAEKRPPLDQLPTPFETIIPNASKIAESTEPGINPKSFTEKYTPTFAKLYRELCREIVTRTVDMPS